MPAVYKSVERRVISCQFSPRSSFKLPFAMLLMTIPSAGHIGSVAFRHSARVYTPLLMTAAANVARRRMATTSGAPVEPDKLSSKGTEPLHQGVEGPHISTLYTTFCFVGYGPRVETTVQGMFYLRPQLRSRLTGTGFCFTLSTHRKS